MRDGRQVTHPGKMHPDIVAPAGPVDENINALAFRNPAGQITGVVLNFGCHCTVTEEEPQYSADYVHYLREHLRQALGPIEIVFLLGACGDVTQIDNRAPEWEKGYAHADKMGAALAAAVTDALAGAAWSDAGDCAAANQTVALAIRAQDASPAPELGLGAGDFWTPVFARERELMNERRATTPVVDCHVTAIKVGKIALVGTGGELFAQPALDIQRASPFEKTWTVTLANEYVGYIPTASAHFAGGMKPARRGRVFLPVEAAQKLTEAALRALKALVDGSA